MSARLFDTAGPAESKRIRSLGIVIPAHNEEALIGSSLLAVRTAVARLGHLRSQVRLVVVLDRCTDATELIVRSMGIATLTVNVGNVGAARAAGFAWCTSTLSAVPAGSAASVWFATTDADTRVSPLWLAEQVRLADAGADAVFGVVDVDDWSLHPAEVRDRFYHVYDGTRRGDPAGHRHVHGANMGMRASVYHQVGGFAALSVGEDQAMSDRLEGEPGIQIVRSTAVRAVTSARLDARAPHGFGALLGHLGEESRLASAGQG